MLSSIQDNFFMHAKRWQLLCSSLIQHFVEKLDNCELFCFHELCREKSSVSDIKMQEERATQKDILNVNHKTVLIFPAKVKHTLYDKLGYEQS